MTQGGHGEQALLTSGEVARRLGIAPATLKRWTDAGKLRCVRTAGGHRRFDARDVERLQVRLEGGTSAVERWVEGVLSDPDAALAAALLLERERRGAWWRVAEALGVVLEEVGRRWEDGEFSVLDEHAASDRLTRALARCCEGLPVDRNAPRILLAAAEGEEHTLGLSLVELTVRERGWRAQWGGRAVPAPEIVRMVERGELEAVALSASVVSDPALLAREAAAVGEACARHGAALVAGGKGSWPEPLPHGTLERTFAGLTRWMSMVERQAVAASPKQRAT